MYNRPQVIMEVKSLEDTAQIITSFFYNDNDLDGTMSNIIGNNIGLDPTTLKGKTNKEKYDIVLEKVSPIYTEHENDMKDKVSQYQQFFNQNVNMIASEFEKIYRIKFSGIRYFTAYISINPICPRYLNDDSFDLYYDMSNQQALETCIHELIHFYWFDIWKEDYPDCDPKTFETPHTEWLLSEIAVDPIIYYSGLNTLCSSQPAYKHFYNQKLWGENMIEVFRKLYRSNTLDNFMEKGLKMLNNNPDLIKELVK